MKFYWVALLLSSVLVGPARAQVSFDEAQRRLEQKKAAHDAAASQPSTISNAELEAMRREIIQLRAENAELRAKLNAALAENSKAKDAAAKADTKDELAIGMTIDEANRVMKAPATKVGESAAGVEYEWPIYSFKTTGEVGGFNLSGGLPSGASRRVRVGRHVATFKDGKIVEFHTEMK